MYVSGTLIVSNWGTLLATSSSRNNISSNRVEMSNREIFDIGIRISSGCDNNKISGNFTYNVGTSVSDNGTGNTITPNNVI